MRLFLTISLGKSEKVGNCEKIGLGGVLNISFTILCMETEYCERYAKKEHISNENPEEESEEEDFSDGKSASSDDDIAGHADP